MAGKADLDARELRDPCPDILELFRHYNRLYFDGRLDRCVVQWSSKRMTSCAGTCTYKPGGEVLLRLSEPILKFRPLADLKNTLLHEMIHALLFVQRIKDSGDHGHVFHKAMNFINSATFPDHQRPAEGYNITVCHSFDDECSYYLTHVWKCEKCNDRIARSINRKPQPADCIVKGKGKCEIIYCKWHQHQQRCGGAYVKIQEPSKPPSIPRQRKKKAAKNSQQLTLKSLWPNKPDKAAVGCDQKQVLKEEVQDVIDLTYQTQCSTAQVDDAMIIDLT